MYVLINQRIKRTHNEQFNMNDVSESHTNLLSSNQTYKLNMIHHVQNITFTNSILYLQTTNMVLSFCSFLDSQILIFGGNESSILFLNSKWTGTHYLKISGQFCKTIYFDKCKFYNIKNFDGPVLVFSRNTVVHFKYCLLTRISGSVMQAEYLDFIYASGLVVKKK